MEFKRRTVACWKLEDEQSRVGSYKKNNSVLEVTRRTAACWQLQAKRQRSIKHVLQGSRRTRTQTTGRFYTPPHPTPPRPTPPHPCQRTENQFGRGPQKTLILRARFSVRWQKLLATTLYSLCRNSGFSKILGEQYQGSTL